MSLVSLCSMYKKLYDMSGMKLYRVKNEAEED